MLELFSTDGEDFSKARKSSLRVTVPSVLEGASYIQVKKIDAKKCVA